MLAKRVLEGGTKGYKNHPQLLRFYEHPTPLVAINFYLNEIYMESLERGYFFDKSKIGDCINCMQMEVSFGQIDYEKEHLYKKLLIRDKPRAEKLKNSKTVCANSIFKMCAGSIAPWEKIFS